MLFLILQRNKTFPEHAKPLILFSQIMSIDHLTLSAELIAALYPESLVLTNFPGPTPVSPLPAGDAEHPYPFWGENKGGLLFLVAYPEHRFLPPEQLIFLQKILAACKRSPEDVAIVNTAGLWVNAESLKTQLRPEIVFLWGVGASALGFSGAFQDFVPTQQDGLTLLPLPAPELINTNSPEGLELKQRLWTCLKKLFSL
jgi:hypothetical protein